MAQKSNTIATYFNFLKLNNIRCFGEERELVLTDENGNLNQWTLILGDNGAGKTTLLQSLVWMRPVLIKFVEGKSSDPLAPTTEGTLGCALQDEPDNELFERLLKINGVFEFKMTAEVSQGGNLSFGSSLGRQKIKTEITAEFDKKRLLESLSQNEIDIADVPAKKFWDPFIVAYGANRQIGFQNAANRDLDDLLGKRLTKSVALY